jgi:hypothetical protein
MPSQSAANSGDLGEGSWRSRAPRRTAVYAVLGATIVQLAGPRLVIPRQPSCTESPFAGPADQHAAFHQPAAPTVAPRPTGCSRRPRAEAAPTLSVFARPWLKNRRGEQVFRWHQGKSDHHCSADRHRSSKGGIPKHYGALEKCGGDKTTYRGHLDNRDAGLLSKSTPGPQPV